MDTMNSLCEFKPKPKGTCITDFFQLPPLQKAAVSTTPPPVININLTVNVNSAPNSTSNVNLDGKGIKRAFSEVETEEDKEDAKPVKKLRKVKRKRIITDPDFRLLPHYRAKSNMFEKDYPHLFEEWHPTLNGTKYQLADFLFQSNVHVYWQCSKDPEHDYWLTAISMRVRGHGCPTCAHENRTLSKLKPQEEFIKDAIEVHGQLYQYDKVIYVNSRTKVIISCTVCKTAFLQTPNQHLCGRGCPTCNSYKPYNQESFIQKANEVHNGKYKYDQVIWVNMRTQVIIFCTICKQEFLQVPQDHVNGCGCSHCKFSRMEQIMHNILSAIRPNPFYQIVKIIRQDKVIMKPFKPDFHIILSSGLDTFYCFVEMDGIQHFQPCRVFGDKKGFEKTRRRDQQKEKMCIERKIHLLRIDYTVKKIDYQHIVNQFFTDVCKHQSEIPLFRKIGPNYKKLKMLNKEIS